MELVTIVLGLVLAQYLYFTLRCGQVRGRLGIPAPAMTGAPEFERRLRVQENTIEQLVVFVPGLFLFAAYVSEPAAAGLGLVFIVGRALYARAYLLDPAKRGPGFLITLLVNAALLLGALVGAILTLV
jgi:hypothetical protein